MKDLIIEKALQYKHEEKPCVISIDGKSAAGKTTLAVSLQKVLGADIIHMDDFFLPMELRTKERLEEAGGNVHYERFMEEVLPFLSEKKPFSYRKFDCSTMEYGSEVKLGACPYRIVEGAYSAHPRFGDYADIKVFLDVKQETQTVRIMTRNGEEKLAIFLSKWIPMEEKYFAEFQIKERADMCFCYE